MENINEKAWLDRNIANCFQPQELMAIDKLNITQSSIKQHYRRIEELLKKLKIGHAGNRRYCL